MGNTTLQHYKRVTRPPLGSPIFLISLLFMNGPIGSSIKLETTTG